MDKSIIRHFLLSAIALFIFISCSLEPSRNAITLPSEKNTQTAQIVTNSHIETPLDGKIKVSLSSRVYSYPYDDKLVSLRDPAFAVTGNIYYLDAHYGSDVLGSGTQGSPWKSLDFVQNKVVPGDGVILGPGNYGDFVYQDNHDSTGDYIVYMAEKPDEVFFSSINLDSASSMPYVVFYDIYIPQNQAARESAAGSEIFFYHDFPRIRTDCRIEYIKLTAVGKNAPLLYTRVSGDSFSFDEYDLSEIINAGSGESFFLTIKTSELAEAVTLKVTFINDDEYAMFIRYETFKKLHPSLFTSREYLEKSGMKGFVGNVDISLQ